MSMYSSPRINKQNAFLAVEALNEQVAGLSVNKQNIAAHEAKSRMK